MAKKVLTPLTELARQAGSAQQIGADTSSGSPQYSFNQSQLTSLQAMSQSPDQQGLAQAVREAGKSYITIPSSGRRILVVFQYFSAGEVAKLRPSPYNVRDCNTLNRDTVLDIYDSIQADGVVHPPYVLASADNFDVVDGWRRTYCLIDQKKGGMFGILQPDGELTPAEIRSISMVSNMRVGNSVWEIGRFITDVQQESSTHLSDRELAIRCGQHLSIVNLAKRAYAIPLTIYQLFEGQTRIGRPAIAKILRIWEPPFLTKGGSHRRRWEGNFVGASAPLVLNVLLNHIQRRPAARACKVGARPKHGLAVSPPQVQKFITQSP